MKFCFDCANLYEIETDICPFCGADTSACTQPKEPYHLTPGSMLKQGKYLIGRAIGYGGFGVTYAALDTVLRRRVAIKEYLPSSYASRSPGTLSVSVFNGDDNSEAYIKGLQSFVNEADRLMRFRNFSGIVTIYDTFTENNTAYIVMEMLDGRTLKTCLEERGSLGFEESLNIITPVLQALEYVHREGMIHRDISPDNIYLTDDGKVKLLDFGAARYAAANVSKSLSVILKPGYAPAEQYSSHGEQGPWSDVYAVGATMYKMLTGITPDEALERAANDTLKPPSKLGVKMPKEAETALLNALNVNCETRTRSAETFLKQLSGGEVERMQDDPKSVKPWSLPKWVYAALAGILLLGGVFAALVLTGVIKLNIGAKVDPSTQALAVVPNLVGMTEEAATLEYSGWRFKTVGVNNTDEVPVGCIMKQEPEFGTTVPEGTVIELTVNGGIPTVSNRMPYLRGAALDEAVSRLEEAGYTCNIDYDYDDTVIAGNVKGTSPEFDSIISTGDEITLTVSLGGLLTGVEIDWADDTIELILGGGGEVLSYLLIPANVDPGSVSIAWKSYDEATAAFAGGRLVPVAEGRTVIELQAGMINSLTGEHITVTDNRYAVVSPDETEPLETPDPTATATPTPKPAATVTATPTAKPTQYSSSISFYSSTFESAFRQFALRYRYIRSMDAPITQEVINSVTTLDLRNCGLTNITDAAKFKNATSMLLSNNNISNLTPLYGLNNLRELTIRGVQASEASIRELHNRLPNCTIYSDYGTFSPS